MAIEKSGFCPDVRHRTPYNLNIGRNIMKWHLLPICLLLNACSNLPPAIEHAPSYDLTYSEASQNIARYKNAPVRWGGVIIDVENEQTKTLVQVLYYPLDGYGRPELEEANKGRFIIETSEFLDPTVYTAGKEITAAGILKGDDERTIGKKVMRLPLILATTTYLWASYDRYYNGYGYGFDYDPYYGGYGFYPYYWGGYYRPYPYYRYW
jgi:outer membrane lipoprotein